MKWALHCFTLNFSALVCRGAVSPPGFSTGRD